jgi:hypothetical protein
MGLLVNLRGNVVNSVLAKAKLCDRAQKMQRNILRGFSFLNL